MKAPQERKWGWRIILKLKNLLRPFLRFEVRDGQNIFYGMIIGMILMGFFFFLNMALHTKLSSALKNSNWFWKPTRLEDLHVIQS